MFSVNIPVPRAVDRLAAELSPELSAFDSRRDRFSLVGKRIGTAAFEAGTTPNKDRAVAELRERLRPLLAPVDPFQIRAPTIAQFDDPARGPGPVVYLKIESPGLLQLHRRLCSIFDPVDDFEAGDYVPHVTLARGGSSQAALRLCEKDIDHIDWTVTEVELFDPEYREPAATLTF
jgi:hypothetical protein